MGFTIGCVSPPKFSVPPSSKPLIWSNKIREIQECCRSPLSVWPRQEWWGSNCIHCCGAKFGVCFLPAGLPPQVLFLLGGQSGVFIPQRTVEVETCHRRVKLYLLGLLNNFRKFEYRINLSLSFSNRCCSLFKFLFQSVGRPKHDTRVLTAFCQMPWFVFDHACMGCCQQWPQMCDKSVT